MDDAAWRELAALAIGAALVDKDVRRRLIDLPTPLWPLSVMADGMRENDADRVWRGLRGYGLDKDGHERVIDRVLEELARQHDIRLLSSLVRDLVDANATGAHDAVDIVLDKFSAHFRKGRNGRTN